MAAAVKALLVLLVYLAAVSGARELQLVLIEQEEATANVRCIDLFVRKWSLGAT